MLGKGAASSEPTTQASLFFLFVLLLALHDIRSGQDARVHIAPEASRRSSLPEQLLSAELR
jgi:hypothetical protein